MFLIFKRKSIFIFLSVSVVALAIITSFCIQPVTIPTNIKTIVIDAGHGGVDGGCVGKRYGAIESELNLLYSQELKKLCEDFGFRVVMTRESAEGLYSPFAKNKKKSEMQKREKIIKESKGDILISIHMNSVSLSNVKGAQVFYKKNNEPGKTLGDTITASLKEGKIGVRSGSSIGDYYILNCNDMPAVLVECGYLSNPEEEYNLMQKEYRAKFCKNVFYGIVNYLKF